MEHRLPSDASDRHASFLIRWNDAQVRAPSPCVGCRRFSCPLFIVAGKAHPNTTFPNKVAHHAHLSQMLAALLGQGRARALRRYSGGCRIRFGGEIQSVSGPGAVCQIVCGGQTCERRRCRYGRPSFRRF